MKNTVDRKCRFRLLQSTIEKNESGIPVVVSKKGDMISVDINAITTIDIDYDDGYTILKVMSNPRPILIDHTFDEAVEIFNSVDKNVQGCVFYRNRVDRNNEVKYSPVMLPNARIGTIDISYNDNDTVLVKTDDGRVAIADSFDEAVEEFNRATDWTSGCTFTRYANGNHVMVPAGRIVDIRESKFDGTTIVYTCNGKLAVREPVEKALNIFNSARSS